MCRLSDRRWCGALKAFGCGRSHLHCRGGTTTSGVSSLRMNKHGYHSSPTRAVLAARGIHFQLPNAINRYFGGKWPIICSPALSQRRGRVGGCNVLPQRSHSDRARGTFFQRWYGKSHNMRRRVHYSEEKLRGFYSKFKALGNRILFQTRCLKSATPTRRQSNSEHISFIHTNRNSSEGKIVGK